MLGLRGVGGNFAGTGVVQLDAQNFVLKSFLHGFHTMTKYDVAAGKCTQLRCEAKEVATYLVWLAAGNPVIQGKSFSSNFFKDYHLQFLFFYFSILYVSILYDWENPNEDVRYISRYNYLDYLLCSSGSSSGLTLGSAQEITYVRGMAQGSC